MSIKQAIEALDGLLQTIYGGRHVPLDDASSGYCNAAVSTAEAALDALRSMPAEPVAAQHRFRHPQKGTPDWSVWQPCAVSNRPAWEIDSQGYEVEYRALCVLAARPSAPTDAKPAQPIQECYGDCPTNPKTCPNPCKFGGRPAQQDAVDAEPASIQPLREALALQGVPIGNMVDRHTAIERTLKAQVAWQRACTTEAIKWLLDRAAISAKKGGAA